MRDVTKLFIISLATVFFSASCVAMESSSSEEISSKDRRADCRAKIIKKMICYAVEIGEELGDLAVRSKYLPDSVHLQLLLEHYEDHDIEFP